ncbi:MAG: MFS transporter [Ectothiorhodospiraceae bacterium]|nr:MFS transporter [Chromatiales bacterium]MCP5154157.1 MFS transporter [Ectothiorhodospiraceae bacterium]
MRGLLDSGALRALGAILVMHSVVTMAGYSIPVIAPQAAADIGIRPESVGFLVATLYVVAMVTGLLSGMLVDRFGPTRLFQVLLLAVAAGCGLLMSSTAVTAFAAAAVLGAVTGPLNPLGSHVLAQTTPTRWRALVFSLKQCGTPAGGMLAGAILPPLALAHDWRVAIAVIPAVALVLVALAPIGRLGGATPGPARRGGILEATVRALRGVVRDPGLRRVAIVGACFAACQMALGSYLVVYLWREAGLSPALAGLAFSALHVAGIVSRIVLGSVADRRISSQRLLMILALVMAASLLGLTQVTAAWPVLAVFAMTAAMGTSGNGWVGLFFSELARLAPSERTAEVAGGGQFVMYGGIVAGPLVFGALLGATGSYGLCLSLFAGVALLAAALAAR